MPQIGEAWAGRASAGNTDGFAEIVRLLLLAISHFQRGAGMPVFEIGRILALSSAEARVVVPTSAGSFDLICEILGWLVDACGLLRSGQPLDAHAGRLPPLLQQLHTRFGAHSVSWQFIAAALRRGVPFYELPDRMTQFGQGHLVHRMCQSLTDRTANIGVHLSRNKFAAAQILGEAGIPVPVHKQVVDEATALKAAEEIGYPVVVKPANLDGGTAVGADLRTPAEVQKAFRIARDKSDQILVEKHVPGRDYRITVFQNHAIWAVERVPGGVVGDGKASVRQLVNRLNADPKRVAAEHAALKPIVFDDEARLLIERAGLTEDSVPAAGQFVRLRRAANVASGGLPVPVFDKMHPDNARLAVRAAAAMGLDMAGVDLLIPDISRSWMETGAAICEINAAPDIGQTTSAHLYEPIFARLVPGTGRIPIILIVGAPPDSLPDRLVAEGLPRPGMTIGYLDRHGPRVGDERLSPGAVQTFLGGRTLVRDRRVEALVMQVNDDGLIRAGLPFPRYDILIVAGEYLTPNYPEQAVSGAASTELMACLLPACDGTVVRLRGADVDIGALKPLTGAGWQEDMPEEALEPFLRSEIERLARVHQESARPPG